MDLADAFALARGLLDAHGLGAWQVEFDAAKRRAGVCHFGQRRIGLSAPLTRLHEEEQVRDTILHEIAHALAGPRHGHDAHWRAIARRIGCSGERCVPADAPRVPAPWLGTCPSGHTVERHRRPERVATCMECSRGFDLAHLFTWTFHGRPTAMHPHYVAELDALLAGRPLLVLPVGARGRVTAPGEWSGVQGTVVKRGRTAYQLKVGRRVLRVPIAWVEPVR
jgi:predicted SprT family Zn-dependent metalloprotease